MHQARRSQCKDWWNAQWRDRVLGAVGWLADGAETMTIPVSSGESLSVSAMPLEFMSPVSYDDPGAAVPVIIPTEYFDADDDEDDDY